MDVILSTYVQDGILYISRKCEGTRFCSVNCTMYYNKAALMFLCEAENPTCLYFLT